MKAENLDELLRKETYLMLCFEGQVYLCKQEFNNKLPSLMSTIPFFFFSAKERSMRMKEQKADKWQLAF